MFGVQPSSLKLTHFLREQTHCPSQWVPGESPKVKTTFLFPGVSQVKVKG